MRQVEIARPAPRPLVERGGPHRVTERMFVEELVDLARSGRTAEAVTTFEGRWVELTYQVEEPALRRLLQAFPKDSLDGSAAMRFVAVVSGVVRGAEAWAVVDDWLRSLRGTGDVDELVLAHLLRAIQRCRAGQHRQARLELDEVRHLIASLGTLPLDTPGLVGYVHLQAGLITLLSGDVRGARTWFQSALEADPDASPRATAQITALLGLVHAFAGEGTFSDQLTAGARSLGVPSAASHSLGAAADFLTRIIRGLDAGDLLAVDRLVRARRPATFGVLGPVALWAHTQYLLLTGRHAHGLRLVAQSEATGPRAGAGAGDGLIHDVECSARAEFHVAAGNLREAWAAVGSGAARGPLSMVAQATILYCSGDFESVRHAARIARSSTDLTPRHQILLRGLEAAAALAQGNVLVADDLLAELVVAARRQGWATFAAHLSPEIVAHGALDERARAAAAPGARSRLEGPTWVRPPAVRTPLSPRESEVLRLVIAGRSREEIAGELGVALNTVKTQIRSVYSKYDVRSRGELMEKVASLPPIWGYEQLA